MFLYSYTHMYKVIYDLVDKMLRFFDTMFYVMQASLSFPCSGIMGIWQYKLALFDQFDLLISSEKILLILLSLYLSCSPPPPRVCVHRGKRCWILWSWSSSRCEPYDVDSGNKTWQEQEVLLAVDTSLDLHYKML